MTKLILFLFVNILQSLQAISVEDFKQRLATIDDFMTKRIADLKTEVVYLKNTNHQITERMLQFEKVIGRQQHEISVLRDALEKLKTSKIVNNQNCFNRTSGTDYGTSRRFRRIEGFSDRNEQTLAENLISKRQHGPPKPAFYAYMNATEISPGKHHTLIFDKVMTNIGYAYSKYSGTFRAQNPGLYVFSFSIIPSGASHIPIEIVKNFDVVGTSITGSYHHLASSTIVIQMSAGDECFIRTSRTVDPSGSIYSEPDGRSSFAGFFLY